MKKYTITQNLTDWEKYRLSLFILFRGKAFSKVTFMVFYPIIILILIFILTADADSVPDKSFTETIAPWIYPSIVILFVTLGPFIIIKLRKMNTPVFELDDWGMTMKYGNKTLSYPWHEITAYSELPKFILIDVGSGKFNTHIIPKKEFGNHEDLKGFIDFLHEKRLKRK
jgi:hypothetical protein